MSATVSMAKLRELTGEDLLDLIEHDEMCAVLDVIQAAQRVRHHDDNDLRPLRPLLEELYACLARFDFGEPS